jgi:hypothetical protein
MDLAAIEAAGAIKLPQSGMYVVHFEDLGDVIDAAVAAGAKLSIVGKTSHNPGAALIVAAGQQDNADRAAADFFVNPPSLTGLSQSLTDLLNRRS